MSIYLPTVLHKCHMMDHVSHIQVEEFGKWPLGEHETPHSSPRPFPLPTNHNHQPQPQPQPQVRPLQLHYTSLRHNYHSNYNYIPTYTYNYNYTALPPTTFRSISGLALLCMIQSNQPPILCYVGHFRHHLVRYILV